MKNFPQTDNSEVVSQLGYYWNRTGGPSGTGAWEKVEGYAGTFTIKEFYLEVVKGNVPGHSALNIFGRNPDVGNSETSIWEYKTSYTYSATADITQFCSDNSSDTGITLQIVGLDSDHVQQVVDVTLDPTDATTLVTFSPALIRISAVHNSSETDLLGNIYVLTSAGTATAGVPDTPSTVRAFIEIGDGMSDMAMYTIPAGKTGYIIFGKTSASSGQDVTVKFFGRKFGGVFMVRHVLDLYSSNYDYFFKVPMMMPEKTDLETRALAGAAGTKVSAAIDIILVDNVIP